MPIRDPDVCVNIKPSDAKQTYTISTDNNSKNITGQKLVATYNNLKREHYYNLWAEGTDSTGGSYRVTSKDYYSWPQPMSYPSYDDYKEVASIIKALLQRLGLKPTEGRTLAGNALELFEAIDQLAFDNLKMTLLVDKLIENGILQEDTLEEQKNETIKDVNPIYDIEPYQEEQKEDDKQ